MWDSILRKLNMHTSDVKWNICFANHRQGVKELTNVFPVSTLKRVLRGGRARGGRDEEWNSCCYNSEAVCTEQLPSPGEEFLFSSFELNPTSYQLRRNPPPPCPWKPTSRKIRVQTSAWDTFPNKKGRRAERASFSSCLQITSFMPSLFGRDSGWKEMETQTNQQKKTSTWKRTNFVLPSIKFDIISL